MYACVYIYVYMYICLYSNKVLIKKPSLPDIINFDNSYSWVTAKKLSYLIEVVAPDNLKDLNVDSTNF